MANKVKHEQGLSRPPIVTVLGHVDHGKTSLLDRIRQTRVAEREVGGITQKIGAWRVGQITFIDTPGHEAFSQMRSRGAKVADLAVLVVAADDGVMPQTLESVKHIKEAGIPFLVALNKIDLPQADPERVKQQLAQNGVELEGYGGNIVCVPVSAKTGQGITDLLEMILLLAQMQEIEADPAAQLEAVVIEAKKSQAGLSATVIIRNGTLKVGDQITLDGVFVKIRGLFDENGQALREVGPGQPAEALGFKNLPSIGAKLEKVDELPPPPTPPKTPVSLPPAESELNKLKIILKVDSAGSLEALKASLPPEVFLVSSGIGDLAESDIFLAQAAKAKIFAFRVKTPSSVLKLAESEKVTIRTYEIVYQFLEELEKDVLEALAPVSKEEVLGRAQIIDEFLTDGLRIAGCRVTEGKITKDTPLRLNRGDRFLGETQIVSMKKRNKVISEAGLKEEFGAVFGPALDFKVGDVLTSFQPKS